MYMISISLLVLIGCKSLVTSSSYYNSVVSYIDTCGFVADFYHKEIDAGGIGERSTLMLAVFGTASFIVKDGSFAKEIYSERHDVMFDTLSNMAKKAAYQEDYELASRSDRVPLPSTLHLPVFHGQSKFVLFFSPVFDNMMIAEIVPVRNRLYPCQTYGCLIRQNRSLKMLFRVGGDSVRSLAHTVVHYE